MEVNSQCTGIGTNNEEPFTAIRRRQFYLNVAHPAQCNGTVNEWRYCFYNPAPIINDDIYITTFAVYRAFNTEDHSVLYRRVSDVTTVFHGVEMI